MTAAITQNPTDAPRPRRRGVTSATIGGAVLAFMVLACLVSLPVTLGSYDNQQLDQTLQAPSGSQIMGTDRLGRSMLARCLLGGSISLGIGLAAAAITTIIGTSWGLISGYLGGRVDAVMMRTVDVLYGLPYILLVVLLSVALQEPDGLVTIGQGLFGWYMLYIVPAIAAVAALIGAFIAWRDGESARILKYIIAGLAVSIGGWLALGCGLIAVGFILSQINSVALNVITLLIAIGAVSWLTLARVVRGQVLSLKNQPFVEAARATGAGSGHIMIRHVLPNLIGPIIVYTTLTVPQAILQESFLSFLGIGVRPPLPSWGNLAAEGLAEMNPVKGHPWLLAFPCLLLAVTLMALNYMGDGLRDRFDPRAKQRV